MFRKIQTLILSLVVSLILSGGIVYAQYSSPHYQSNEVFFGAGGDAASSANYKSRSAVGELGVGNIHSNDYQAYAGFTTTDEPLLEVAVTGGTFDLGVLTTAHVSVITTVFTVRNYLSNGYVVAIGGAPPHNGAHNLAPLTSPASSSAGTEQFGINLVANNIPPPPAGNPGAFGADPAQIPDTTFGFGAATNGYGTANSFKYNTDATDTTDTVAQSLQSSGLTRYTLSAIANISPVSPGGSYGTSLFVRVTPTF